MDVYKIGVEIALANSMSAGLGTIASQLMGIKSHTKDLEKAFASNGLMALGVAGIGLGMLKISGALLSNGAELTKQIGQMKFLLDDYKDVGKNVAVATLTATSTPGTTIAQNVKGITEITPTVESHEQARIMLPLIMPDVIAASRVTGQSIDDILTMGMRAESLVGHNINPKTKEFDAERMRRGFKAQMAMLIAGGHNINLGDVLNFAQQMAAAGKLDDNEVGFWRQSTTPIIEMGGHRAGTAGQAITKQLVGGRMSMAAVKNLIKQGVLDQSKVHPAGPMNVTLDDGAWIGEDLLKQGNFSEWFQKSYRPQLEKNKGRPLTSYELIKELSRGMSTNTATRLSSLYIMSQAQMLRDQSLFDTVMKKDLYKGVMDSDLGANTNALSTATQSLLQVLGQGMVPAAIAGLQALTKAISDFTQYLSVFGFNKPGDGAGTRRERVKSELSQETPDLARIAKWFTVPPNSGEKSFSLEGNRLVRTRMDPNQISNPTPINLTPQIQATTNVSIDGKALAAYVTQMVIKSIGNLIPHPTGAPMAGTSQFAPAFDSGASH